jgi:hypothetical protein
MTTTKHATTNGRGDTQPRQVSGATHRMMTAANREHMRTTTL